MLVSAWDSKQSRYDGPSTRQGVGEIPTNRPGEQFVANNVRDNTNRSNQHGPMQRNKDNDWKTTGMELQIALLSRMRQNNPR